MSIIAFEKIKGIGVYPDFKWPHGLENFKAFNLIYGWNGSGKTTLSRLLRYLESNDNLPEDWNPEFKINTDEGCVENSNPDFLYGTICVFNVDFIEKNIKWIDGRTNKLLIGETNQALASKLINDRQVFKEKTEKNTEESRALEKTKKEHDNFLQKRASDIKKRLTTNIQDQYRNYNIRGLKDAFSFLGEQENGSYALDQEKEAILNSEIQQNSMLELSFANLPKAMDTSLLKEAKELLFKSPASSFIEALKKDAELNAWVKKGFDIHTHRSESTCLFCLQFLPSSRLPDLEKHFSQEYRNFIDSIDKVGVSIKSFRDKYAGINLARSADFYNEYQEEYKTPQESFYKLRVQWQEKIDYILEHLRQKRENPFESAESDFIQETIKLDSEISSSLTITNILVAKHNEKAKNLSAYIGEAKKTIEYGVVAALLDEHHKYQESISLLEKNISEGNKELSALKKEIEETEAKTIQPKIGENKINKDLHRFLGRNDIKLHYEEDGYTIIRNEKKAKNLSESEKTAIALIYFFSKIHEGKDIGEKIIIIDDPVSSLDSQSIHFALSYIRDKITSAKQVFFLTHNFYCLKEVKNWKGRKGYKKENFSIYMLECRAPDDKSQREAILCELDPLLEKYDSEYHFLFSRLYEWHANKPQSTLEDMYPLANMARKVLETFLAFKAPQTKHADEQLKQIGGLENDEINCLIRFLNISSHSDAPERVVEFPLYSLEEMAKIIGSLIRFIEKTDSEHFTGMKSVIEGQAMSKKDKAAA